MEILLKRAYEKPSRKDGFRVLVDRLWPRGVKKSELRLDAWAKDIAPSTELRKWFGHEPKRWLEFGRRYRLELKNPMARAAITGIIQAAGNHSTMTLIYAAKDSEHNEAVVLLAFFRRRVSAKTAARSPRARSAS